jgi:glycosyltransferase involved in cell wall biosynthesis
MLVAMEALTPAADGPRRDVVAVIPAYRCAETIGRVVAGVRRYIQTVVVIDDGSDDETTSLACRAGAVVKTLPTNRGKGEALRIGIERALEGSPEAILLLDADGQHAPEDIPKLLGPWDRGEGELIIGTRLSDRDAIPSPRYWTNYAGSKVLSLMTGYRLEDSQSGFRLLQADLLRWMNLRSRGYAVESEMLIKASKRKARVVHVPVRTIYEEGGASHFRPFIDTLRISWWSVYYKAFG